MVGRSPIISVRLSMALKDEVARRAKEQGITSQDYALRAIRLKMDTEDKEVEEVKYEP